MMATPPPPPEAHCASVLCQVPAQQAFAFLADGLALGQWALGAWHTVAVGEGVVRGQSLFDDQPSWVRPVGDLARLTIDYHVGSSPDALQPRISAVVQAGETLGRGADCCQVSLHAIRSPGMDDARWLRLVRCHEVEVLLIEARLALQAASAVLRDNT
ncbi:hypothetical protein [Polaromonas sp. SM01]|uniref:hypothetical protein n=1 Tax=Polaromonas sp. SM01 TaxID=3085630 RepID=UPI0029811BD2|nr:hypothetical protein [Polaromonas sp. SM01]MDW5441120.1 hypothetical protein [Polaromonas sp. SM01]